MTTEVQTETDSETEKQNPQIVNKKGRKFFAKEFRQNLLKSNEELNR